MSTEQSLPLLALMATQDPAHILPVRRAYHSNSAQGRQSQALLCRVSFLRFLSSLVGIEVCSCGVLTQGRRQKSLPSTESGAGIGKHKEKFCLGETQGGDMQQYQTLWVRSFCQGSIMGLPEVEDSVLLGQILFMERDSFDNCSSWLLGSLLQDCFTSLHFMFTSTVDFGGRTFFGNVYNFIISFFLGVVLRHVKTKL